MKLNADLFVGMVVKNLNLKRNRMTPRVDPVKNEIQEIQAMSWIQEKNKEILQEGEKKKNDDMGGTKDLPQGFS
jgi:hypothetical protein